MSLSPSTNPPAEMVLDALNASLTLGDVQLRNRVLMASLTRNRSVPADFANDLNKDCEHLFDLGSLGMLSTSKDSRSNFPRRTVERQADLTRFYPFIALGDIHNIRKFTQTTPNALREMSD